MPLILWQSNFFEVLSPKKNVKSHHQRGCQKIISIEGESEKWYTHDIKIKSNPIKEEKKIKKK